MSRETHTYPSKYPPGSHWAVTEAWSILDVLPPGTLDQEQRALIAGMIAGTLVRIASESLAALTPLSRETP